MDERNEAENERIGRQEDDKRMKTSAGITRLISLQEKSHEQTERFDHWHKISMLCEDKERRDQERKEGQIKILQEYCLFKSFNGNNMNLKEMFLACNRGIDRMRCRRETHWHRDAMRD